MRLETGLGKFNLYSCIPVFLYLKKKRCSKRTFGSDFVNLGSEIYFNLQIWISPERVGEKTGCLAFIGISRPYFAITNKTRVQGRKIRNKFKN